MHPALIYLQDTSAVEPWSATELAIRFGFPFAVVLVGLIVFLGGRTERKVLKAEATQRGGFGGPPGTTDVGTAEGFDIERFRNEMHVATRKVLIGLLIMLGGSLTLLGVTFWRIFS
ncbi:MAG: hypothetical protein WBG36_14725 [Ornithinimicrobium sp.]